MILVRLGVLTWYAFSSHISLCANETELLLAKLRKKNKLFQYYVRHIPFGTSNIIFDSASNVFTVL